jgi:putative restriction endonuclease
MRLEIILRDLVRLKRGSTKYGMAPHKPVLFLTLLDMMDSGIGNDNRFYVDSDLVGTFHQNWSILVRTGHQEDFTQPFFYMQHDKIDASPFWHLVPKAGYSINTHIKNIQTLADVLNYAAFSESLFSVLTVFESRALVRAYLLNTFFADLKNLYYAAKQSGESYLKNIEGYILNEMPPVQRLQVAEEEMVYVRNGTFKKWIPKIYQNTCCISGMKLVSAYGYSLLDACHIIPFSKNQDDRVTNGLALCPNLHRAFDRGLISIDADYKVIVSDQIMEDQSHPYGLTHFIGRRILLPSERHHQPAQENLEWHRLSTFSK